MYFFHCDETRPLVSIFTYIDAMLLNLEAPVPQQTKRKFVIQKFPKISNFSKNFKILKLKKKKIIIIFKISIFFKILKLLKNFRISKISKTFKIFIRFQNFQTSVFIKFHKSSKFKI